MNFRIRKRLAAGGLSSISRRFLEITAAYGLNSGKFVEKLESYNSILRRHGAAASLAATAISVERNPRVFKELQDDGAELLVQAYRHIDYSNVSDDKQEEDVSKAVSVFKKYGLKFSGFRAPYLKYSQKTREILKKYFKYNSGEKFLWDCDLNIPCQKSSKSFVSIPYSRNSLLEIPVSLPSDIWLLHRRRLKSQEEISQFWVNTLDCSYNRGELFTLQLHPENIYKCDKALDCLLSSAEEKNPKVLVARLSDIVDWWAEREKYSLLREVGGKHKISVYCAEKATLVVKNLKVSSSKPWFGGCRVVPVKDFSVDVNPCVGVSASASEDLKNFLKREGFIVEESTAKNEYGLFFEDEKFSEEDKLRILKEIEDSEKPYVRLWRWPNEARSCLSISGDIDCVTLLDYVYRAFER